MLVFIALGTILFQVVLVSSQEACNAYVDKVLRDLKDDREYFQDPYVIPEKTVEFHKKLLFINYTGEARLSDGYIFGMSTLHRDGDVIVDRKSRIHLKIYLGAGELKLQCNGLAKFMGHGPQVKIEAKATFVNMKLDIVPNDKGTNPKVANFIIEDTKGIDAKVSGLGPLNFVLNSYIKAIRSVFKRLIRAEFEDRLKKFMGKKLKAYIIPQDCLNDVY